MSVQHEFPFHRILFKCSAHLTGLVFVKVANIRSLRAHVLFSSQKSNEVHRGVRLLSSRVFFQFLPDVYKKERLILLTLDIFFAHTINDVRRP